MQLVITTYGTYLNKVGDCFHLKSQEKEHKFSARKISSIVVGNAISITTDAVELAIDNNIDIVFLDKFGNPYGRIWHPKLGSTTLIRRYQLEWGSQEKGFELAKEWVLTKCDNQVEFLRDLQKARPKKKEMLEKFIAQIVPLQTEIKNMSGTLTEKRLCIMGLEGSISRIYFKSLADLMPPRYKFEGRSRQPAKDGFNCLLNYAYGILYGQVEKACIIAGLDPYAGFLHTDNYNKPALVFDLIEMFRHLADRAAVYLFSRRLVTEDIFDKVRGGLSLNEKGKQLLITHFNQRLDKKVCYRKRQIKQSNIIQLECHRIAQHILKTAKNELRLGENDEIKF